MIEELTLTRKKRIRASHKASATRNITKVEELLVSTGSGGVLDASRLSQLKMSLQEKLDVLKCLDGEILELVEEDKLADEIELSDKLKEGIYAALDIDRKIVPSSDLLPPPAMRAAGHARDAVIPVSLSRSGNRVKLPKLTMHPFNGDITTWTTFWDSRVSYPHVLSFRPISSTI